MNLVFLIYVSTKRTQSSIVHADGSGSIWVEYAAQNLVIGES